MSMNIASLVKIPCYLLQLSSGNENMGVSRAGNSVKIWRNLPISNPKPDIHNINAHTKFGENPLMFTQVIIRKRKTDGRTQDGRTDGRTDTRTSNVKPKYTATIVWRGIKTSSYFIRLRCSTSQYFNKCVSLMRNKMHIAWILCRWKKKSIYNFK